ncbi:hypothetical protein Pelo_9700 [Pelomyxa schiedti]|nr:hypothetical protein Pelo_9700 [Pelomyxa schiedti]
MQKDSRHHLEQMLKSHCIDEEGCAFILSYRNTLVALAEESAAEHFTGIEGIAEFDKWTMVGVGGYCTASIEEVVDPCLAKRDLSQLAAKLLFVQNLGKSLASKDISQLFESVCQRVIQKIVKAACIPSVEELLRQQATAVLESPGCQVGGVPLLEVSRSLLLLSEAQEKLYSLPHVNAVTELRVHTLTQLQYILTKSFKAVQVVPSDVSAFSLHFLTIKMVARNHDLCSLLSKLDLDVAAQFRKAVLSIKDYCLSFLEQVGQLTGSSEEIQGKELTWKVAQVMRLKDLDEGITCEVQKKFAITIANLLSYLRETQKVLQELLTKFPTDFRRVNEMIVQIKRTSWVDEYFSGCPEALLTKIYAHLQGIAERTEKRIQDAWSVRLFAQVGVYFEQLAAMRVLGSVIPSFHEIEERCSIHAITQIKELCNSLSQGDLDFRKTSHGFLDMMEIEKLCTTNDQLMIARTLTKECKDALFIQLGDKMEVMLQNLGLLETPVPEKIKILKTCKWAIAQQHLQSICTLEQVLLSLHTIFNTIMSRITSLDTPETEAQELLSLAAEHMVLGIYVPEVRQWVEECRSRLVISLFNKRDAEGVQRELLKLKKEFGKSVHHQRILDLTGAFNKLCADRASLSPSSFEFLWKVSSSLIKDLPSSELTKLCQEFVNISLDMIKKIRKETEPVVTAEFATVACLPGPQQSQLAGLGLVLFILPYCTRHEGIFAVDPLRDKASSMVKECTTLMEVMKSQAEKLLNTFHSSLSRNNFVEVTTVLPDIKRLELGHKCLQPLAAQLHLNHPTFPTLEQFCDKVKEQLASISAECEQKLDAHTPTTFAEVEVIWKSEAAVHHMFKEVPETTVEFEIKQKVTKFFNERNATALKLWNTEPRNYAAINELLVLFINGRSLCATLNIGPPQQFMEKVLEGVMTTHPSPDPNEVVNMLHDISTHNCFTIMCMDESGSSDGGPWTSLKTAVDGFCTRRSSLCKQAGFPCEDRVWVIGYSDSAFHRIPSSLEAEPERLVSGLSSRLTHFDGGMTSFQAPLTAVKQVLDGSGPNRRPIADMMKVLLFTTYSKCDDGDAEMQKLYNAHPDLKVFVIGFGEGCDTERLKSLAVQGHGSYFGGLDSAALMRMFDTLASAISALGCMFKIEGSDCCVGQSCPIPFHPSSREHPFWIDVQPNASGGMTSPLPGQMTQGKTCFEGASLLPIDSTAAKTRDMVMKIIFNWENAPQQALLQSKYMTECIILSLVPDHPNVIHPLGALVLPCMSAEFVEKIPSDKIYFREQLANNKSLAILMPHCGITLASFFLSSSSNHLTVEHAWNLFFQGLRAICHIESHFVVHREIKGDNILIDPDTGKLTLIDFGDAQCCPNMEALVSATSQAWGNPGTMPPELSICLRKITTETSDVFSYSKCDSFALALTFWNALLPQSNRFIGSTMNHDMSTFNTQSLLSHFPVPLFSLASTLSQQQARESPQTQTQPHQSVATLQHPHDNVLESVMIGMMNPDKAARLGAADAIHSLNS